MFVGHPFMGEADKSIVGDVFMGKNHHELCFNYKNLVEL